MKKILKLTKNFFQIFSAVQSTIIGKNVIEYPDIYKRNLILGYRGFSLIKIKSDNSGTLILNSPTGKTTDKIVITKL